jgi:small subunit ribosomal protein S2
LEAITLDQLVDNGVHFGCRVSRWNPKMKPYIYGKRNQIHIIDLRQTVRGLLRAVHFLRNISATGDQVLFVGTKRQVKDVLESEAKRSNMPFVSERWIGGTLTNFEIIRKRMSRLLELEAIEQDGRAESLSKKMLSKLRRERRKITRNLDGIRTMHRLPAALFVIDPKREENAVKEAARMGIPTVALADTDCDPNLVDILIPANDDALKSVSLLLKRVADAVAEGYASAAEQNLIRSQEEPIADEPRPMARRQGGGDRRRGGGGGGGGDRRGPGRGGPGGRRGGPDGGRFGQRPQPGAEAGEGGGEAEAGGEASQG